MSGDKKLEILFIDFFDSFSYNIVQLIEKLDHHVEIYSYLEILKNKNNIFSYDLVVLGPGPGHLNDYAEFCAFIRDSIKAQVFLGICLGHQLLGSIFGVGLKRLSRPIHGKSLKVDKAFSYLGVDCCEAKAMFYNSWTLEEKLLGPQNYCVSEQGMVTLIDLPNALGLQFHPESIGTSCPDVVLDNALKIVYNKKNEDSTTNHWSVRPENYSASQGKQSL